MKTYQNFIGGRFVAAGGKTIDVINPATEEIISRVPETPVEQVREAIDAAERAQKSWGKLPAIQRAGHLRRIAQKIRGQSDALARVIVEAQGKTHGLAKVEVEL